MIAIFDTNHDESIDFKEFIRALAIFSVDGAKEAKLKFAFQVYDIDCDGFISNGELFQVLKMMVGSNLTDVQLQQIVDKTIIEADTIDRDGKISFEEFCKVCLASSSSSLSLHIHSWVPSSSSSQVVGSSDIDQKMTVKF